MRLAVLSYDTQSRNLGDEVQSIAAARLLPRLDLTIPRYHLRDFSSDEQCLLVMNGYFDKNRTPQFPPAECITPLYMSFHIAADSKEYFTTSECIAHFRKHAPIGCRDRGTADILRQAGVDAFYNKCLTLTLAKREPSSATQGIVLCDVFPHRAMSIAHFRRLVNQEKKSVKIVSHFHGIDFLGAEVKMSLAEELLSVYEKSELVVTSRMHCALPCVAMGVPVLYFGTSEYRTDVLSDIGVKRYPPLLSNPFFRPLLPLYRNVPFEGETFDIEEEKQTIIAAFQEKLAPHL